MAPDPPSKRLRLASPKRAVPEWRSRHRKKEQRLKKLVAVRYLLYAAADRTESHPQNVRRQLSRPSVERGIQPPQSLPSHDKRVQQHAPARSHILESSRKEGGPDKRPQRSRRGGAKSGP